MNIYEEFRINLIIEFEKKRDLLVAQKKHCVLEPLFGVSSDKDKLYSDILFSFSVIAVQSIEKLICALCNEKGIKFTYSPSPSLCSFAIDIDGVNTVIDVKTNPNNFNSASSFRLVDTLNKIEKPAIIVFLVKDSLESRRAIDKHLNILKKNANTDIAGYTFEAFLEAVFGIDELHDYQSSMINFKEEMYKTIGYQVTELCSPYHREKLKKELDSFIRNFSYLSIKNIRFEEALSSNPNASDLNYKNYTIIFNSFINDERYKLLLGNSDFAESFITSEWLFQKYFILEELDNTFIVAGYLKSIEQLLWEIIFVVGKGRSLRGITIDESSVDEIDKTLGSLQMFLSNYSNDDLFLNTFGFGKHYVMNYLKSQLSDWRVKYRNGYFHKHNLSDKSRIEAIRNESLFLYMLILGSLNLDHSQLHRLS